MQVQTQNKPSYFLSPGVGIKQNYDVVDFIKSNVSNFYKIPQDVLFSKSRKRELVWPRQVTAFLIKKHTKLSLQAIGAKIGKDHATVIHSVKVVNNLSETNRNLRESVQLIDQMVTNSIGGVYQYVLLEISREFEIAPGSLSAPIEQMNVKEYQAYCGAVWVLQSVKKVTNALLSKSFSVTPEKITKLLADKHHFTRIDPNYLSSLMQVRQKVSGHFASYSLKAIQDENSI